MPNLQPLLDRSSYFQQFRYVEPNRPIPSMLVSPSTCHRRTVVHDELCHSGLNSTGMPKKRREKDSGRESRILRLDVYIFYSVRTAVITVTNGLRNSSSCNVISFNRNVMTS